jgi:hypothetical protein
VRRQAVKRRKILYPAQIVLVRAQRGCAADYPKAEEIRRCAQTVYDMSADVAKAVNRHCNRMHGPLPLFMVVSARNRICPHLWTYHIIFCGVGNRTRTGRKWKALCINEKF